MAKWEEGKTGEMLSYEGIMAECQGGLLHNRRLGLHCKDLSDGA